MSFQILKNNEPLPINQLDKEAAEFWNKKPHNKQYAHPYDYPTNGSFKERMNCSWMLSNNWFDFIGYNIHYSQATTWDEVRESISNIFDGDINNLVVKPHMELITHWEELEYVPKYVV